MVIPPWLLALTLAALALLALWVLALSRRGSTRSRARVRRAQRGEEAAEALLEDEGYTVVERQAPGSWSLRLDGEEFEVQVRADLIVEREGLRYVAEVKTGSLATDPLYPPTRRQLLEYWVAFEPDGLLLIDVEAGRIIEVELD